MEYFMLKFIIFRKYIMEELYSKQWKTVVRGKRIKNKGGDEFFLFNNVDEKTSDPNVRGDYTGRNKLDQFVEIDSNNTRNYAHPTKDKYYYPN
jgi:hypothetical protein